MISGNGSDQIYRKSASPSKTIENATQAMEKLILQVWLNYICDAILTHNAAITRNESGVYLFYQE